jgi:DNA-binding NtrC family response regulator
MSTSKMVFVVDEEPLAGRNLVRALQRPDWSLRYFADPQEALAAVDSRAPDLVIADGQLGAMNGVEFLGEVRRHDPSTRTILVSNRDATPAARRALRDGAIDALAAKPADEMLVGMARQLLGESTEDDWFSAVG